MTAHAAHAAAILHATYNMQYLPHMYNQMMLNNAETMRENNTKYQQSIFAGFKDNPRFLQNLLVLASSQQGIQQTGLNAQPSGSATAPTNERRRRRRSPPIASVSVFVANSPTASSTSVNGASPGAGDYGSSSQALSPGEPQAKKTSQKPEKQFTCQICHRSFGYKHVLQNHERTHTGEKPFKCQKCGKRFTRDHHLKTHTRLHTGEKPYICSFCNRTFVQVANLRRHIRVHTGEKPYHCTHCDTHYSDSNQLKSHLSSAHNVIAGERLFMCQNCSLTFKKKCLLKDHVCDQSIMENVDVLNSNSYEEESTTPEPYESVDAANNLNPDMFPNSPSPEMKASIQLNLTEILNHNRYVDTYEHSSSFPDPSEAHYPVQTEPEDLSVRRRTTP